MIGRVLFPFRLVAQIHCTNALCDVTGIFVGFAERGG